MRNKPGVFCLLLGAVSNFLIAALHLAIPLGGREWYLYFGGSFLLDLLNSGSPLPALLTFALAGVFALCGVYALSGAGIIRRLPLLRLGLLGIGGVFFLRGLDLFSPWFMDQHTLFRPPLRFTVFSAVALGTGIALLLGLVLLWKKLSPPDIKGVSPA